MRAIVSKRPGSAPDVTARRILRMPGERQDSAQEAAHVIRMSKEERIMPKMKTKRAAAKRFKVTGTGKIKRFKAYKRHILTKKSTKRKRVLRQSAILDETNVKNMKKVMPYL